MYGRLAALPDAGRAVAALAAAGGVVGGYRDHPASPYRSAARSGPELDAALEALARGDSAIAIARLARLDDRLASAPAPGQRRRRSPGARQYPCNLGGAHPTCLLLRRGSARVRFTEIDLFGVYVAPMSLMMVAAWLVTIALRRVAGRFGLLRYVWHPALFVFAVYMIVLSSMVAYRRALSSPCPILETKAKSEQDGRLIATPSGPPSLQLRETRPARRLRIIPAVDHPGGGRACRGARLGDVGRLYGRTVDARRHGARLCRHDGAGGRRAHRRVARSPTTSSCTRATC